MTINDRFSGTHPEDGVTPVLHRLELNIDADTLTSKDDIGDTAVRELGPARLAAECEIHVPDSRVSKVHRIDLVIHLMSAWIWLKPRRNLW